MYQRKKEKRNPLKTIFGGGRREEGDKEGTVVTKEE